MVSGSPRKLQALSRRDERRQSQQANPAPSQAALRPTGAARAVQSAFVFLRSKRVRSLAFACVVLTGLPFALAATSEATQTRTAAQLLKAAFSDATASGSVHQSMTNASGSLPVTFSDDVTTDSGSQHITRPGGTNAHVLVIGKTAYISGDLSALTTYFGFSRTVATKIGDRWVSIASTNAGYATVASDATLTSVLANLTPHGQLTELAATKMHGRSVIGVRGALPSSLNGTVTIYITRSSHPLPVFAVFKAQERGIAVTSNSTMSAWGERVALKRPTDVISASKL